MTDETDGKVTIELVGDVSRREFFSATAKFGVTTALVAAAAAAPLRPLPRPKNQPLFDTNFRLSHCT